MFQKNTNIEIDWVLSPALSFSTIRLKFLAVATVALNTFFMAFGIVSEKVKNYIIVSRKLFSKQFFY